MLNCVRIQAAGYTKIVSTSRLLQEEIGMTKIKKIGRIERLSLIRKLKKIVDGEDKSLAKKALMVLEDIKLFKKLIMKERERKNDMAFAQILRKEIGDLDPIKLGRLGGYRGHRSGKPMGWWEYKTPLGSVHNGPSLILWGNGNYMVIPPVNKSIDKLF